MTSAATAPLRLDAERNRLRILDTARELFARDGIDIAMTEIARQAGVGPATLFRRFPTREDLVVAVFDAKMSEYADAVTAALEDTDPWHGFCAYVERVCEMQADDRGFMQVLVHRFPGSARFEAERDRGYAGFVEVIARAKTAGRLREDFVPEDLVLVLMANAGVAGAMRSHAPHAWRRLVGFLLQSFDARAARPLPDPPTPRQTARALG